MSNLYVVATPIGNLSDFSTRAVDILNNVNIIMAEDTRTSKILLNYYNINKQMISLHKFNEMHKSSSIIDKILNEHLDAALISDAGTPCISDPGCIIINEARERGMNIIAVPGCSAIVASLSISGFCFNSFTFYGFLCKKTKDQQKALKDIILKSEIAIFYESPNRILSFLNSIYLQDNNAEVCVCKEITKIHERSIRGTITTVIDYFKNDEYVLKGEYCVIVKWNSSKNHLDVENEISLEAKVYDLIYVKSYTKDDAFKFLINQGYKKNQIYKVVIGLSKRILH